MVTMLLVYCTVYAAPAAGDQAALIGLMNEGVNALKAGQYEKGIEKFKEIEQLDPQNSTAVYNIACGYSLLGKKDEAISYLKKAVSLGFAEAELLDTDPDLANIRSEKGYQEARAELDAKFAERRTQALKKACEEMRAALGKKEPLFAFGFDLADIEGKKISLDELRGRVVLVDVWGTWCGPCVRTVPHLVKLQKEYGDKGLVVVGLAYERVEGAEATEKVKAFAQKAGINYRCALIDREFTKRIPDFKGFPTLVFIDREGKVRFVRLGYSEYEVLAGAIQEMLGGAAPAAKERRKKWF
jgi:thiol-disulfide isomerase/thioredoxin